MLLIVACLISSVLYGRVTGVSRVLSSSRTRGSSLGSRVPFETVVFLIHGEPSSRLTADRRSRRRVRSRTVIDVCPAKVRSMSEICGLYSRGNTSCPIEERHFFL